METDPPPAAHPPDVWIASTTLEGTTVVLKPHGPLSHVTEALAPLVVAAGTLGTAALFIWPLVERLDDGGTAMFFVVFGLILLLGAAGLLLGMALGVLLMLGLDRLLARLTEEQILLHGQHLRLDRPAGEVRLVATDVLFVEEGAAAVHLVLAGGEKVAVGQGRSEATRAWLATLLRQHLQHRAALGSAEDVPEALRALRQSQAP